MNFIKFTISKTYNIYKIKKLKKRIYLISMEENKNKKPNYQLIFYEEIGWVYLDTSNWISEEEILMSIRKIFCSILISGMLLLGSPNISFAVQKLPHHINRTETITIYENDKEHEIERHDPIIRIDYRVRPLKRKYIDKNVFSLRIKQNRLLVLEVVKLIQKKTNITY
uniref:Uncharacterized protein n=1 Tax=Neotessella volvocina TaxID=52559 RepID=A0A3G2R0H4_9STRA|nr:hypothetical protein [Neotessella volvocina]